MMFNIQNIEKTILSTILYDSNLVDDISSILKIEDFLNLDHQEIFRVILELYSDDLPIDEAFIAQRTKCLNTNVLIDVFTATPLANKNHIIEYCKEIKKVSISSRVTILSSKLATKFDVYLIDQINKLKEEIDNLEHIKIRKSKNWLLTELEKDNLVWSEINELKVEYIYDQFFVKNEITFWAAPPGNGKSTVAFELLQKAVISGKADCLIYLDCDNSKTTVQQRRIHDVVETNRKKIKYLVAKTRNEINNNLNKIAKSDLFDLILVFDSIKNFFDGLDRDKNRDVSKIMKMLKAFRDAGATILFLHHTNKPKKDIDDIYAGSSAFIEDTSNAYMLKFNRDNNCFVFDNIKSRVGNLVNIAFSYDFENRILTEVVYDEAKQTKEMKEIIDVIKHFIYSSRNAPSFTEIIQNLLERGYAKTKCESILSSNKNKIWKMEKDRYNNNRASFSLIEPIIVIENNEIFENHTISLGKQNKLGNPAGSDLMINEEKKETRKPVTNAMQNLNYNYDTPIVGGVI